MHDARETGGDGGQVTVLAAAVVLVAVVVVLALAQLGRIALLQAKAEAAADAAALAALDGGSAAAERLAAANGARVEAVVLQPGWAQVTVRCQGRRATATAALVSDRRPAGAPSSPGRAASAIIGPDGSAAFS